MSLLEQLKDKSESQCELCSARDTLSVHEVPPVSTSGLDGSLLDCETCNSQIENLETSNANHWHFLKEVCGANMIRLR